MIMTVKEKGLVFIELVVAMAIVAVLAVSASTAVPPMIEKAYDAHRKDDIHKIKNHIEEYYSYTAEYPKALPECGKDFMFKETVLLKSFPCDPVTHQPYFYQVRGDDSQAYRLYAVLTNKQDISIVDVGCAGGCGPDCFYNYGVSSANTSIVRCSYVCAPGGGQTGECERYEDPATSQCPKEYVGDATCKNECDNPKNCCHDASGKMKGNGW